MSKLFSNLLAVAALACMSTATTMAAEQFTFSNGVIELGKTYTITDFSSAEGVLTPTSSGTLIQDGVADLEIQGVTPTYAGYGSNGQMKSYQVEKDKAYTVSASFVMQGGDVVFYMESDAGLQLVSADPEEGSVVTSTVNYTGDIVLQFNNNVQYTAAQLIVGAKEVALPRPQMVTNTIALNIKPAFASLYESGDLNPAGQTPFTIRIDGLKSTSGLQYGTNGILEINYIAGAKATELISANVVNGYILKSYYPASDAQGILTFTFDNDLANDGLTIATIGGGDIENDLYYFEELPVKIDGPTAEVNLTGVLRDLRNYPLNNNLIAFKLSNVRDASGNLAAGYGQGNVGSYSYSFVYEYIVPVNIVSEFVPESGSSLAGYDEIEIWFNNSSKIAYDGVLFTWDSGSLVVPTEELDLSVSGQETTIKVAIPEDIKDKALTVTLNNMVSLDGYDHSAQVTAQYNQFVAWLLAPITNGQTLASTGEDDFCIKCNMTPGYMRYDFYNQIDADNPTGWAYGTYFTKQEDGTWTAYNGNYTCYSNFTPRMVISAYDSEISWAQGEEPFAKAEFTFVGTTKAFEYSDFTFVSIDPANESSLTPPFDDFCFTLTFDGLVSLDPDKTGILLGMGMGLMPFEKIEAANVGEGDPEGLANTWKLYPGNEYMNNHDAISISVKAYDMDGMLIQGNMGGRQYDYLNFNYSIHNTALMGQLVVVPEEGNVFEISQFIVMADNKPVGLTYSCSQKPTIYNKLREPIYIFEEENIEVKSEQIGWDDETQTPIYSEMTWVVMTVDPMITADGTYILDIPEGYFMVGNQFEAVINSAYMGVYTIGASAGLKLNVEPADGETLTEISEIIINTPAQLNMECEDYITLYAESMWSNIADWSVWSINNKMVEIVEDGATIGYRLLLDETITADDTYTLTIPANMFVLDGVYNQWTYLTYYIGSGSGDQGTAVLVITPENGSTVEVLDKIYFMNDFISVNWNQTNPITISSSDGTLVFTATPDDVPEYLPDPDNWFVAYRYIEPNITAPGVYIMDVPALFFDIWPEYSVATTCIYTISESSSVSSLIVDKADRYEVYNMQGIRVMSTSVASDLSNLRRGLYIINGKKVAVK